MFVESELGEFLELITYGFTNPMPDADEGPWKITAKDVINGRVNFDSARRTTLEAFQNDLTDKSRPIVGDVLLTKDGTLGRLAVVKQEGLCVNQSVAVLRPNGKITSTFLYYLLASPSSQNKLIADSDGSVLKHIYITRVPKMMVSVPTLKEQKAIAHILGTLDDKIELNQKMNQTLEEIAKAIFKSWFVDFDPVRAKAEGKPTGLSKEISDLFPDSFEDSELGEIPTGWKVSKLESIFDVLGGHAFKSKDYVDNGVFVLRTKNFNKGIAEPLHDDVFLPKSFLDSHQDFICEEYDYHLVMVGASLGKTGMIFPSMMPALRNQNMWCFRPREAKFSKLFTKFVVDTVTKKLLGFASGSARDFFKKGDFRSHKLVIPPETILESFRSITDPLLTKKSKNIEETKLITNLRDILLPKLISGELQIPDAENLIEEADI